MMDIRLDDLSGPAMARLIDEHLAQMHAQTPAESVHALALDSLRTPDITVWSVWEGAELLGCGALKELDATHGEIKSMRTATAHRRKGVAAAMVEHLLGEARRRSYHRVSLETGSQDAFEPARRLYARYGFQFCGPFGDYKDDPNSVFMTREV